MTTKLIPGHRNSFYAYAGVVSHLKSSNNSKAAVNIRNVASNVPKQSAAEFCMDAVRKYEYENFLCTLLLAKEIRAAAFAVRAFNIEVAQIQDLVSNADIGNMRMHFWKDAIEKIYQGNPPHQPVALELARILDRHKLSKHWFKRLISSREKVLSAHRFPSLTSVEEYAETSVSPIYYLLLESAGVKNVQVDHVASHLGKAQGIVTLIRGIPFNASKRRVYLPQDVLIKHQVSQEDIIRGTRDQKMKDLVYDVACVAHENLETARSMKNDVPKPACLIFLPAIAVNEYLKQLEKFEFDVYHPVLQKRNSVLPVLLWWNKLRNIY